MTTDFGDLHDGADLDGQLPEEGEDCDGCDGGGIHCPAGPSCLLTELPDGWEFVERCDLCEIYPDDLSAAEVVCDDALWLPCSEGGWHVAGHVKVPVAG